MTKHKARREITGDRSQAARLEQARIEAEEDRAVDWLLAVRKYGIEEANRMFPDGEDLAT